MGEIIFCAAAAMVGAGFASGREIMRFFSQYGAFSWALVIFAALVTAWMLRRMLALGGVQSRLGKGLLCLCQSCGEGIIKEWEAAHGND